MLKKLALQTPGYGRIEAPEGIPTGGFMGGGGTANNILQTGIELAFFGAILLALFVIIWGGISWIMSGGDKQKLANARNRIIYAIIGMVLVFLSIMIVNLFTGFFGAPAQLTAGSESEIPSATTGRTDTNNDTNGKKNKNDKKNKGGKGGKGGKNKK